MYNQSTYYKKMGYTKQYGVYNIQSVIIFNINAIFSIFSLIPKNKNNYLLIIGMIPLLLIATFRVNVGTDLEVTILCLIDIIIFSNGS